MTVDQFNLPYVMEVRPHVEFKYDSAKGKLLSLNLHAEDGPRLNFNTPGDVVVPDRYADRDEGTGTQERLLRFGGWMNLENMMTVGCAGAIIAYLQRRRAAAYLPGDSNAHNFFRISRVENFTIKDSM